MGDSPDAERRAASRPRLDCVDVLATAQQSVEQGAAILPAEIKPDCFSPDASGGCTFRDSFLSGTASFLSVSQWPDSSRATAGTMMCALFAGACASLSSSAPQSFSPSVFFGLLNRAPLQAPVAQLPSTPAQQGMEHECEADRTESGTALDKSARVKSAAKIARKGGRVW